MFMQIKYVFSVLSIIQGNLKICYFSYMYIKLYFLKVRMWLSHFFSAAPKTPLK